MYQTPLALPPEPPRKRKAISSGKNHDQEVTLTGEALQLARKLIQDMYLRYKQPWIIGVINRKG